MESSDKNGKQLRNVRSYKSIYIYKILCLPVCLCVRYTRSNQWVDLDQTLHAGSLPHRAGYRWVKVGIILLAGTYARTLSTAHAQKVKVGMILRACTHDLSTFWAEVAGNRSLPIKNFNNV